MRRLVAGAMLLAASVLSTLAFEVVGYDPGGMLEFQGAAVSNYYSLEFAPSVAGPWTNWGAVSSQPITGAVMSVPTPLFFRVAQRAPAAVTVARDTAGVWKDGLNANEDRDFDVLSRSVGETNQYRRIFLPFSGSIVAITCTAAAYVSNGVALFYPTVDHAVNSNLVTFLDAQASNRNYAVCAPGVVPFSAGQWIGVRASSTNLRFRTSDSYDITVRLYVTYNPVP